MNLGGVAGVHTPKSILNTYKYFWQLKAGPVRTLQQGTVLGLCLWSPCGGWTEHHVSCPWTLTFVLTHMGLWTQIPVHTK